MGSVKRIVATRPDRSQSATARYVATVKATRTGSEAIDGDPIPSKQENLQGNNPPLKGGLIIPCPPERKEKEEASNLDRVLELALSLSAAEQKQLVARLALNVQQAALDGSVRDLDMWVTALSDSIVRAVAGEGGAGLGPVLIKRAVTATSSWGHVREFMEQSKLSELTVVERQAAYSHLADMVVRYARSIGARRDIPVTAKFLASMSSEIRAIFDHNFPGYLVSGLAPAIFKGLRGVPPESM